MDATACMQMHLNMMVMVMPFEIITIAKPE
jgi:hypothetical protein